MLSKFYLLVLSALLFTFNTVIPSYAVDTAQQEIARKIIPIITMLLLADSTPTNSAPIISGTPDVSTNLYKTYRFTQTASDADNNTLTFNISNKPAWATFDTSTGFLQGIPDSEISNDNIVISVSDGLLNTDLPSFSIQIQPAIDLAHTYGVATQGGSPSY